MLVFISGEFRKNLVSLSRQFAASAKRRFEFHKRRQPFIRMHNKPLFVAPDARLQSRSFPRWNQSLRPSRNPQKRRNCLDNFDALPVKGVYAPKRKQGETAH
jgi:hypothetical protein